MPGFNLSAETLHFKGFLIKCVLSFNLRHSEQDLQCLMHPPAWIFFKSLEGALLLAAYWFSLTNTMEEHILNSFFCDAIWFITFNV